MSTERDTTRIVRSWLEDGVTALPDRVLDTVLDQVPATPQRRSWWPPRRIAYMNTYAKLGAAGAAVVLVAVIGYSTLPGGGSGGRPTPPPTPPPTAAPSPTAGSSALKATDVGRRFGAGTYTLVDTRFGKPFTIELPSAWTFSELDNVTAVFSAVDGAYAFAVFRIEAVYRDPCHPEAGYGATGSGLIRYPNVDEIAGAFANLVDFDATAIGRVQVDGLPTRHLTISNAIDTAAAKCTNGGLLPLFDKVGGEPASTNGGTSQELWILDADGERIVLVNEGQASDPQTHEANLATILGSLHFE